MEGKLMQAVQYDRYGGGGAALKLVEIPIPSPKKGQILLKVEATSLNPADWKIQSGALRPILPPRFPFTPGTDVAGEVVAIGSDVAGFKAGDKVVAILDYRAGGGLAEYAVAEAKYTVLRPAGMSPETAASIPMAGLTALHTLRSLSLDPAAPATSPTNILVTAASGGVGHFAVQLAKLCNCHVTATCGSRNLDLIKTLGADEVLDYKTPAGAALLSPSSKKYSAVVNCASGIPWSTLKPNLVDSGRVADVAPTFWDFVTAGLQKLGFCKKRRFMLMSTPDGDGLRFLVDLQKKEQLRSVVDSTFPLDRAAEAFEKSKEGHATGKIIVKISTLG